MLSTITKIIVFVFPYTGFYVQSRINPSYHRPLAQRWPNAGSILAHTTSRVFRPFIFMFVHSTGSLYGFLHFMKSMGVILTNF